MSTNQQKMATSIQLFSPYSKFRALSKAKKYMRAETSKQLNNQSSQMNRKITEGKRKEEDSYAQVLSLQDVFSDSANLQGR